jgi:hypothetical protein
VISETLTANADDKRAVVFAGDYLNKLTGEQIEREVPPPSGRRLQGARRKLFANRDRQQHRSLDPPRRHRFREGTGARVVFSEVKEETVELFDMLGLTRHVEVV